LRKKITEAARQIAPRRLSTVEITRAYLARLERLNPGINAYITVNAEATLEEARRLETELAAGRRRGPLHGLSIALKDDIDTASVRTTAASALFAGRTPGEDAVVVRKLRRCSVPRQAEHARINGLGIPTISVPCGFTRQGFPIGLQISGPRLGESRVLALAHAYEQATDWRHRQPALA
jgi:Asp-tRNA(Asn)/Glu-tRNA(Gln) amidotransferase A subunit family amidase